MSIRRQLSTPKSGDRSGLRIPLSRASNPLFSPLASSDCEAGLPNIWPRRDFVRRCHKRIERRERICD